MSDPETITFTCAELERAHDDEAFAHQLAQRMAEHGVKACLGIMRAVVMIAEQINEDVEQIRRMN